MDNVAYDRTINYGTCAIFESYIHFVLMYTADHIFPVLLIKDLINKYGVPTTPFKLSTGMKPSISHLSVLIFPFVVRKYTSHVGTNALNMRHRWQKVFRGIFVGIPQHQERYLFTYPTNARSYLRTMSFLNDIFSSALAYTSHPYSEAMDMLPTVYVLYA